MPDLTPTRPTSGTPIESSWGQQVHDALEGIQSGATPVALTATVATDVAVTFPRAYAAAPAVVVCSTGGNTYLADLPSLPTTSGFTIRLFKRDGTAMATGTTITVYWLAVGVPA